MLNILPITTEIMPQFIQNFIIFNDYSGILHFVIINSAIRNCTETQDKLTVILYCIVKMKALISGYACITPWQVILVHSVQL